MTIIIANGSGTMETLAHACSHNRIAYSSIIAINTGGKHKLTENVAKLITIKDSLNFCHAV